MNEGRDIASTEFDMKKLLGFSLRVSEEISSLIEQVENLVDTKIFTEEISINNFKTFLFNFLLNKDIPERNSELFRSLFKVQVDKLNPVTKESLKTLLEKHFTEKDYRPTVPNAKNHFFALPETAASTRKLESEYFASTARYMEGQIARTNELLFKEYILQKCDIEQTQEEEYSSPQK